MEGESVLGSRTEDWKMTGVWAALVSAGTVIGCGRRRQHEWPASGLQGSGRETEEKKKKHQLKAVREKRKRGRDRTKTVCNECN